MVRGLLGQVALEGLPGDHHFYLTFGTREPGVVMSPGVRKQHPEEMTIVLQYQFWNLVVDEDTFQVTLRFGGAPEPLTVPWAALRAFADPSVGFGMRLQATDGPGGDSAAPEGREGQALPAADAAVPGTSEPVPMTAGNVLSFGAHRRRDDGKA